MKIKKEKDGHWHHNHGVSKCVYHLVFCPKYRRKVLVPPIDTALKRLIKGKQEEYGFKVLEMEVMPDHVHLLLQCTPDLGIMNVMRKIKGYTARELRIRYPQLRSRLPCLWTRGKYIATVGSVQLETVKNYIANQKNV